MSQSFRETEGLIVVMNDIITQGNVVIVSFGGSVCDWVINASRMDVSIFYSLMIVCLYVSVHPSGKLNSLKILKNFENGFCKCGYGCIMIMQQ